MSILKIFNPYYHKYNSLLKVYKQAIRDRDEAWKRLGDIKDSLGNYVVKTVKAKGW